MSCLPSLDKESRLLNHSQGIKGKEAQYSSIIIWYIFWQRHFLKLCNILLNIFVVLRDIREETVEISKESFTNYFCSH